MTLEDEIKTNVKLKIEQTFPGFRIDFTTLDPDINTNPLSIFNNDIVDSIYVYIKDSEIRKAKAKYYRP